MNADKIIVENKILDLDKVYRTCLSSGLELSPIFSTQNEETWLLEILAEHCQIKITQDDSLPKNICTNCLDETTRIQNFIELCKQSENSLKECLSYETIETKEIEVKLELDEENDNNEPDIYDNSVDDSLFNEEMCIKSEDEHTSSTDKDEVKVKLLTKSKKKMKKKEKKYECVYCLETFDKKIAYWIHRRTHEENETAPFECHKCDKKYSTRKPLRKHLKEIHGEIIFRCKYCEVGYSVLTLLKDHERKHTGERPFSCTHCSRTFRTSRLLKLHIKRLKDKDKPKPKPKKKSQFLCAICGRQLASKQSLEYHIKAHNDDRPVECDICGKKFTHLTPLKQHKILHTRDHKKIKCK